MYLAAGLVWGVGSEMTPFAWCLVVDGGRAGVAGAVGRNAFTWPLLDGDHLGAPRPLTWQLRAPQGSRK